jgi:glycerol uptake facilitator protein
LAWVLSIFQLTPHPKSRGGVWTWLLGWGKNAFPGAGPGGYWWIPIVGPLVGAVIGTYIYKYFIELTLEHRAKLNQVPESEPGDGETEKGMITSD